MISIFPLRTFHLCAGSAYGVYIFLLIRNFRACGSYRDFLDRGLTLLLTRKIPNQGSKLNLWKCTVATMT